MKRKHRNSGRWWILKITRFCSCPLVIILSDYSDLTRRWGEKIYCSFYLWIWFSKSPRNLHLRSCKPVVLVSIQWQCNANEWLHLREAEQLKVKLKLIHAPPQFGAGGWRLSFVAVSVHRTSDATDYCQWCYRCDKAIKGIDRGITGKMSWLISNES